MGSGLTSKKWILGNWQALLPQTWNAGRGVDGIFGGGASDSTSASPSYPRALWVDLTSGVEPN